MNIASFNGLRNGDGVRNGEGILSGKSNRGQRSLRGARQRRDRTLVFRLSQEEYESLVAATEEQGGRSVSDFVRTAVLSTVENGQDHTSMPGRLRELEQRVRKLETAYLGLLKEGA